MHRLPAQPCTHTHLRMLSALLACFACCLDATTQPLCTSMVLRRASRSVQSLQRADTSRASCIRKILSRCLCLLPWRLGHMYTFHKQPASPLWLTVVQRCCSIAHHTAAEGRMAFASIACTQGKARLLTL